MTQQTTIDMLRGMKMSAMAAELEKQMGDPAFRELGFEDRLGLLVNAQNRYRGRRRNRGSDLRTWYDTVYSHKSWDQWTALHCL